VVPCQPAPATPDGCVASCLGAGSAACGAAPWVGSGGGHRHRVPRPRTRGLVDAASPPLPPPIGKKP
jgi:hypothetical protein